ncbi:MAG: ribonuclease E activity regulator RraA, partial [Rhodocyclaceae bacterium]|nr:ribonuclease E activity regulator RraA [Rhodocyclaceae bacterium]
MTFQTADLCDEYDERVRVVAPMGFRSFGGRPAFGGPITTIKAFEDNSLVRTALEGGGEGRVLVVDGGGSMRCAMVGDQLALLGVTNGWSGILVYGCIRDSAAIGEMDIGVMALATHPRKSVKKGIGERDITVNFGGIAFVPGQHLYADADGILVSDVAADLKAV